LPYDPANLGIEIYSKKFKTDTQKITYTQTFITVQVTLAKRRKQPKCPSTDEWINKM
jgi:hypothetical protein